jgi:hybrid cluster-associated redox disulfide protein
VARIFKLETEEIMQVTKDTIIEEVLRAHPNAIQVLMKYNLGCVACMGATQESIEQGARMHGVDPEPIVKELNELFSQQAPEDK